MVRFFRTRDWGFNLIAFLTLMVVIIAIYSLIPHEPYAGSRGGMVSIQISGGVLTGK